MTTPTNQPFRSELWEADEYVVTFNGRPIGNTAHKRESQQLVTWLNTYHQEIAQTTPDPVGLIASLQKQVEQLRKALTSAQCDCTPRERDSGHKSGCWKPYADEALEQTKP